MPYENTIIPTALRSARKAFLCARLNLRGARRLLQKESLRRGGSTLYDSVVFAMMYLTVERFPWQGSVTLDANEILVEVEDMLRKLGVIKIQKTQ